MKTSLTKSISNLPTVSDVLQRINRVVSNPDSSGQDLVDAVKLDPAIAGKILRLANSAYFGLTRRVSSLQNAVVLLGQKRIHSLVLSSTLSSKFYFHPGLSFDIKNYWGHSIAVAHIGESIARYQSRNEPIDSDEVFSAGLLHDVGKLVLCGFEGELVAAVLRRAEARNCAFYQAEDPGNSHIKVGAGLAKHWNFPEPLLCSIVYHHDPIASPDHLKKLSALIHIADAVAHVLGFSIFQKEIPPEISTEAVDIAGVSPEQLRVIASKAIEDQKKFESLINFFT